MDDMKTYYCERIKKDVVAEGMDDLTGRVIIVCKYYNMNPNSLCFINFLENKRCLVKLAVQREAKEKSKLVS